MLSFSFFSPTKFKILNQIIVFEKFLKTLECYSKDKDSIIFYMSQKENIIFIRKYFKDNFRIPSKTLGKKYKYKIAGNHKIL